MALIECRNLTLGYEGKHILEGLNFSVEPGDYLCIVGENGSGKSTLMKTILGLIRPISGNIVFGEGLKATGIGYLPQQNQMQRDFPASVREVVISGCLNKTGLRPFYSAAEKKTAEANMKKLGLTVLANRCYRELSGGQQQRVLLARALCATGKMILLDEPVSGLDPKVTSEMYEIIDSLNKNDGITVVMISHDIESALMYSKHILHIGRDIFFGSTEDYLKSRFSTAFKGGEGNG